jgi:hypothetical protein
MIFVGGLASACSTTVPPQSAPEMSADGPAWDATGKLASNVEDQDIVEYDPTDPWGPFIAEAAERFDVPEPWIRAVMQKESGGRAFVNGRPIRSPAGAIGLMQVMPDTYRLMRDRYGLGNDPADPYDNIMAGSAYLREMYEEFGTPFFLAAYNCGPKCAANISAGTQRMPRETRKYLAVLKSRIEEHTPQRPDWSISEVKVAVANLENRGEERPTRSRRIVVAARTETAPAAVPAGISARRSQQVVSVAPVAPAAMVQVAEALPAPAPLPAAEPAVVPAALRTALPPAEPAVRLVFMPLGDSNACGRLRKSNACVASATIDPS